MDEHQKVLIAQKKFARFSQAVLVLAGCILLAVPSVHFPTYYRSKLMGLVAFLYAVGIHLPTIVFRLPARSDSVRAHEKEFVRGQLQVALSAGFLLGGLGSLGFWSAHIAGIPYDKFVHIAFSALAMVFGTYALRVWHGWSLRKTALIVALIGIVLSIAWEFVEFFSDRWLHFGYFGRLFDYDSRSDIYADFFGIAIGGVIIAWRQWRALISPVRHFK